MTEVTEVSIAELRDALEPGYTTAVELVQAYLARIDAYDAPGTPTALNAVVVRNPDALAEVQASDARRTRNETLGPLDGIPCTVKDSHLVKDLIAAPGSPTFKDLVAQHDAFTVERLHAAGVICLGKTSMPPMANGSMQRGAYDCAESPYNAAYLTAPFASGSSNDAGAATAASFVAFGLAEETWSSGRGPVSNNGLCTYTPSRGVISVRGNWSPTPTMDVVMPYARNMADLLEVLDVVIADDPDTRGDLWRMQPWVPIPKASEVRPASCPALAVGAETPTGKHLGVPRMFISADPDAGTSGSPGIGGPTGRRIHTRLLVIALWERTRKILEAAGAEVIEVDFPLVSNCEGDRPGTPTVFDRGLVSKKFLHDKLWEFSAWGFDDFLRANGDPKLNRLADVDGLQIFPHDPGTLPNREDDLAAGMDEYVRMAERGIKPWDRIATFPDGLYGLEETRRINLKEWMRRLRLDAVLFLTVADVGSVDADVNPASADIAWSNGIWVANDNLAIRHLDVPTVTVPMGVMADIGMPVDLTFAGRAYDDSALLRFATAPESTGSRRIVPPRTPPLANK